MLLCSSCGLFGGVVSFAGAGASFVCDGLGTEAVAVVFGWAGTGAGCAAGGAAVFVAPPLVAGLGADVVAAVTSDDCFGAVVVVAAPAAGMVGFVEAAGTGAGEGEVVG